MNHRVVSNFQDCLLLFGRNGHLGWLQIKFDFRSFQVISQIVALQESTPSMVEPLDKILEVLRQSELYAPYLTQQVREDKFTSELVGGLMTVC